MLEVQVWNRQIFDTVFGGYVWVFLDEIYYLHTHFSYRGIKLMLCTTKIYFFKIVFENDYDNCTTKFMATSPWLPNLFLKGTRTSPYQTFCGGWVELKPC